MIRFIHDTTVSGIRYGEGSIVTLMPAIEAQLIALGAAETAFATNDNGDVTGIESNGSLLASPVYPYYHFHGFAKNQILGDPKFWDIAAGNHGARGANLSGAQMFAHAGYVSTVDPVAGSTDSAIRIPAINFDYGGGEKLIVWWLGAASPEGADVAFMGDGYGTTEGQRGWRVRARTNGKFQIDLWGASQGFAGTSTGIPFDGTLHSMAFCLDGETQEYGMWVDEVYEPGFGAALWPFHRGVSFDTKNANTVNIGTSHPASAGSTVGMAVRTRALVILRLPSSANPLFPAALTPLFEQLRANPGKLISASAF